MPDRDYASRLAELEAQVATVHARHDGHEKLCSERWTESRNALTEFRQTMTAFVKEQRDNHTTNVMRFQTLEQLVAMARGAWWGVSTMAAVLGAIVGVVSRFVFH